MKRADDTPRIPSKFARRLDRVLFVISAVIVIFFLMPTGRGGTDRHDAGEGWYVFVLWLAIGYAVVYIARHPGMIKRKKI